MKNITRKLLCISLASAILIAPASAKDALERRVHDENKQTATKREYKIKCSFLHVGNGYYTTAEDNKEYDIKLKAGPTGFFEFLGLKYEFSTNGYKEDGALYPKHFYRINKGKDKGPTQIEVTDIYYDYENLEAKGYAYKETDGKREIKWNTMNNPTKITKNVKDFLTVIEELKKDGLKDNYEFQTVAKGKVHPFQIRKIDEETIKLNGERYETVVYETEVHKDLFGIDSKAKIWVHKEPDHTILKCWVENGPLWTSINLNYSGRKAGLKQLNF